jgi:AcrR family transcriptional regulator
VETSHSGDGRRAKGERTRERIVAVAAEVFAETGYTSGSMREIAARAGLAQAGLRHHFRDKFDLLTRVLELRDASVAASLEEVPEGRADQRAEQIVRHAQQNPGLTSLYRVLSAEAGSSAHPAHDYFVARYDAALAEGAALVRRAQDAGIIDPGKDPRVVASTLIAVIDGLQIQMALVDDLDPVEVTRQFIADYLSPRERTETTAD